MLLELDVRLTKLRCPTVDKRTPKARRLFGERIKLSERLVELRNLPLAGLETEKRVNLSPPSEESAYV